MKTLGWVLVVGACVLALSGFALARPGGGKTFGGPSASASAQNPYLVKSKKDKAPKEEPGSEAWTHRPGYAAPWTVPSAAPSAKTRTAGMPPPAKPESRGGAFAYFFWVVIGSLLAAGALFAARIMKERSQAAWITAPTKVEEAAGEPDDLEQEDADDRTS